MPPILTSQIQLPSKAQSPNAGQGIRMDSQYEALAIAVQEAELARQKAGNLINGKPTYNLDRLTR